MLEVMIFFVTLSGRMVNLFHVLC